MMSVARTAQCPVLSAQCPVLSAHSVSVMNGPYSLVTHTEVAPQGQKWFDNIYWGLEFFLIL